MVMGEIHASQNAGAKFAGTRDAKKSQRRPADKDDCSTQIAAPSYGMLAAMCQQVPRGHCRKVALTNRAYCAKATGIVKQGRKLFFFAPPNLVAFHGPKSFAQREIF
jgi:hypothetical protein